MKKYFSFFSVLGGVAELGIAAVYTVFSILFLIFGYKDYLINRRWIVPLGCFCVITSFHFLTGMAIRNVSRYFERCPVLFGEVGCSIGIAGIMVWEMLAWLIDILQVKGAEGFMVFAVFLLLLHQRICLCYLFKNYGKSGAMFYLLMYAASALVLVTDEVTDEVLRSYRGNWMMIWRVVPIWLIGTFLLGLLGHLLSAAFRKKKGEFWEGQNRHRRVCMGVLSGGIVCFLFMVVSRETADNMLSPSPRRDEDGYYLLCSREGFEWFIDRTGSGDEERDINVRLAADIVLNDTSDWEGAKEKIRESARLYCGEGIEGLRFYRYGLDGDEFLYGYSFRLYAGRCPFESTLRSGAGGQDPVRIPEALNCAVFYRVREGLVAEFIGIEPVSENMHVLERTRYLAARVADGPALFGRKYSPTEFYGWEGWAFGRLHNPFAVALECSPDAECAPLRMAKGPQ